MVSRDSQPLKPGDERQASVWDLTAPQETRAPASYRVANRKATGIAQRFSLQEVKMPLERMHVINDPNPDGIKMGGHEGGPNVS